MLLIEVDFLFVYSLILHVDILQGKQNSAIFILNIMNCKEFRDKKYDFYTTN